MSAASWRPGAGVAWVVERSSVTLVRSAANVAHLQHPEAALWDLVTRGIHGRRLVALMTAVMSCPEQTAATYVGDALQRWCEAGLIVEDV